MTEKNRKAYEKVFTKNMSEKNIYKYITNNISFESDFYPKDYFYENIDWLLISTNIRQTIVDKIHFIEENQIDEITFSNGVWMMRNVNDRKNNYEIIDVWYDSDGENKYYRKQYLLKILYIDFYSPYVINITNSTEMNLYNAHWNWQRECSIDEKIYLFELNFTEPVIPEKKYYTLREDMDDFSDLF